MCGIFGLFVQRGSRCTPAFIQRAVASLARHSESRGKDSSGIALRDGRQQEYVVLKGTVPITELLKRKAVADRLKQLIQATQVTGNGDQGSDFSVMGHSRLVTNGSQLVAENNQPVVKSGLLGIHNGIIVNENELWTSHPDLERSFEIDTEVILALVRKRLDQGSPIAEAISRTAAEIYGTFSISLMAVDRGLLALATNNGSLYTLEHDAMRIFAFASEEFFLKDFSRRMELQRFGDIQIRAIEPDGGAIFDFQDFTLQGFLFRNACEAKARETSIDPQYRISVESIPSAGPQRELILDPAKVLLGLRATSEAALLEYNVERIRQLRRCTKCLLPETFPYIDYHENGVCNYCRNYTLKNSPKPIDELFELVGPYRRSDGRQDCIVPYSGGRDSTFALHLVKDFLKLNPIAFTYDWGMVNDLARRNIARVCGKLKVENIIVSANIAWKRENIRKNVLAWLARPHLGMVPLFMAGDKFFFYYTDQIRKRTGIRLNIWGINPLENTDFKVGFLHVPPDHRKKRIYSLSLARQARLIASVGQAFVCNPRYLNYSVFDTVGSFLSRSVAPHRDYYHLYDYYRWDEGEIEKLVREEYRWETAIDTRTTWRIGDGTAAFYNYIYCTVAGFSEYDTFRSNQIREGALDRAEALALIEVENRPRYASIKWYTDIINLEFSSVIGRINSIPKLYS